MDGAHIRKKLKYTTIGLLYSTKGRNLYKQSKRQSFRTVCRTPPALDPCYFSNWWQIKPMNNNLSTDVAQENSEFYADFTEQSINIC